MPYLPVFPEIIGIEPGTDETIEADAFFRCFLLCYNREAQEAAGVAELVDARDLKFSSKIK
jgi:hypothetical protein